MCNARTHARVFFFFFLISPSRLLCVSSSLLFSFPLFSPSSDPPTSSTRNPLRVTFFALHFTNHPTPNIAIPFFFLCLYLYRSLHLPSLSVTFLLSLTLLSRTHSSLLCLAPSFRHISPTNLDLHLSPLTSLINLCLRPVSLVFSS